MHIWCSVIFCLMVSAGYVDATLGDACSAMNGGCTSHNNELCDTTTTETCVCKTGYMGSCHPINCGPPTAPGNGSVDFGDGTWFDSKATFSCDSGFSPDATATSECQSGGTWSITSHTCTIKDCEAPTDPDDGATSVGVTTYRATATVTCDAGFGLSTDTATATITCQANASWSALPTCNADCEAPTDPDDGATSVGVTTYQSTATVTCDAGFGLSTDTATATITCQAGGSWSALPNCTVEDAANCGDPPSAPDNGVILTPATANTEGHEATVACDNGYTLDGASTMTCQHNDTWSTTGTCSGSTSVAWSFYVLLLLGAITRLMKE